MTGQASSESRGSCEVKVELKVPVDEVWKLLGYWREIGESRQYIGETKVEIAEGENNTPNYVRLVTGNRVDRSKTFGREKLLTRDEKTHNLMYEVEENSFGFTVFKRKLYFRLVDVGNGTSVVDWTNKFDLPSTTPMDIVAPKVKEISTQKVSKQLPPLFLHLQ